MSRCFIGSSFLMHVKNWFLEEKLITRKNRFAEALGF